MYLLQLYKTDILQNLLRVKYVVKPSNMEYKAFMYINYGRKHSIKNEDYTHYGPEYVYIQTHYFYFLKAVYTNVYVHSKVNFHHQHVSNITVKFNNTINISCKACTYMLNILCTKTFSSNTINSYSEIPRKYIACFNIYYFFNK